MSEKFFDVPTSYATNKERRVMMSARVRRGSVFTELEDVAVANTWIAVSKDANVGADQKGDEFFRGVHEFYSTNFTPTGRPFGTVDSVNIRGTLIINSCKSFTACFARIVRSNPSGTNPDDYIKSEMAIYNGQKVEWAVDDVEPPFEFFAAFKVLHDHLKFMMAFGQ